MKRLLLICACAGAALLAACGGANDSAAPAAQAPMLAATRVAASAPAHTAADYNDLVQRIYVAYFGRPSDAGGLAFFSQNYLAAGAPTVVAGMTDAYAANPAVKALVDSFATSAESQALYPGDNVAFVDAVYRNLFNRSAEAAGSAYWVNAINQGFATRANAALAIMAGAQGTDLDLVNKKNIVASAFTASLNTDTKRAAYDGLDANVVVRTMLSNVNGATVTGAAFQPTIDATIITLVNMKTPPAPVVTYAQVAAIIQSRCVGCHSAHPSIGGFSPAPLGIKYDTEAQIRGDAGRIYEFAVVESYMPYGNITNMTDAERQVVGAWFNAGTP